MGGFTSLRRLGLENNSITDISALGGLTGRQNLSLHHNPNLTDIQPLLDNAELGAGALVSLGNTSVSCADVALLRAKGVGRTTESLVCE